jgi:hypothetical protein
MKYYYWLIIVIVSFVVGFCRGTKRAESSIAKTGHGGYFYQEYQIIGQTSAIGEIEITEHSIWGDYTDIERTVSILGNNWRIPTIEELKLIDQHRIEISAQIDKTSYWSSNRNPKNKKENLQYDFEDGHIQSIFNGDADAQSFFERSGAMRQFAILVRDIK